VLVGAMTMKRSVDTMAKKKEIVDLGFIEHPHQTQFLLNWKKRNELICTRRWGKTVLACMKLTDSALEIANRRKQPKFAYIAPQKEQARELTWPIFKEFLWPLVERGFAKINDQSMEVHFLNSRGKPWAQIKLYGADKGGAEPIRGNYLDGAVLDEGDQIDFPKIYREIVRPTLSDTDGWLLVTGTIRGKGHLYNLYQDNRDNDSWNIGVYKFEDCWMDLPAYCRQDAESKLWVPAQDKYDEVRDDYKNAPNAYAREYQCDWNADGNDPLIPNRILDPAMGRHIAEDQYSFAAVVLGVDVAGEGPDSHTICRRQGNASFPIIEIKDANEMELADIVARHIDKYQADMCFIDHTGGYGAGTLARLRQLGYTRVQGINFGSKPADPHYSNKRTEMYHEVRDWLEAGGCLPKDGTLEQELSILSCVETMSGKAMLMKKDDIREIIGRSPDRADALALTFASPVKPQGHVLQARNHKTAASTGYNPLKRRQAYGFLR
jgi:hypothetical protein